MFHELTFIFKIYFIIKTLHLTIVLFGCLLSLDLPGSFQSALHGAVTAPGYKEGIRKTIKIGGCNASRSGFIGACTAAKVSVHVVNLMHSPKVLILPVFKITSIIK